MCSERDSPLEPFVLPAPGQPELARLTCGAHLGPPVLTRKQKRPRVNLLVCDRAAAFCAAGPPEVLSRMSRPVTQAAERERELARARSQRLKQASPSLPGESVSRGFTDRGALEGYPSHYTSLVRMQYQITIGTRQQIIFLWTMTKCDDKTQEYLVFIGHSYLKQKFHRTGKVWLIKTRTKYAKSDGFHLLHIYFERVFMLKMLSKLWFCQFQLKCWIWLIK